MPLAVHGCWRRVYDYCLSEFTPIPGYRESDAQLSADAAVAGWYQADGRLRAARPLWRLPDLGTLMVLGEFRGIWSCDADGTIWHATDSDSRLPLYWSEDTKTAVVFPRLRLQLSKAAPPKREDQLMKMWARGRGVRRTFDSPNTPEPTMVPSHVGIAVEYHSDKFTHGEGVHYVHHFEPGVVSSISRANHSGGDPVAIALRGGQLRITQHGLEG